MSRQDELYRDWKARKAEVVVPDGFVSAVMAGVDRQAAEDAARPARSDSRLIRLSRRPLARVGLVAAAAVLGFVRLAAVTHLVLGTVAGG
ncbi:MAG TPA: hypothetical protein PKY77_04030 [Phycisphaerae bacterium]|nr:hypothetical protein [Phycisphaerae bacterium]HRY67059.1 hypothetical protein [Phycisphaerae bacterium]HSA27756.1 hypothetical protein [Phycisphaerae bacterium]